MLKQSLQTSELSKIRAGDVVKLGNEELIVAYVRYGYFSWLGWPYGEARLSDISEIVEKCADDEHRSILERLIESSAECGKYAWQDLFVLNQGYVGSGI